MRAVYELPRRLSWQRDALSNAKIGSRRGDQPGPDAPGLLLSLASGLAAPPLLRWRALWAPTGTPASSARPARWLSLSFKIAASAAASVCASARPMSFSPADLPADWRRCGRRCCNNRIGSSGCQLNCVACGKACPTAAIRHISLEEKLGTGKFAADGPIRLGTAFVDRGRCLPWVMDKPCIVCQELPVSPKAIFVGEVFSTIRGGVLAIKEVQGDTLTFAAAVPLGGQFTGSDYFCLLPDGGRAAIAAGTAQSLTLAPRTKSGRRQMPARRSRFKSAFNSRTSTFGRASAAVSASTNAPSAAPGPSASRPRTSRGAIIEDCCFKAAVASRGGTRRCLLCSHLPCPASFLDPIAKSCRGDLKCLKTARIYHAVIC